MTTSIEFFKLGDKRMVTETLTPGIYDLCKDGQFIRLHRACTIAAHQAFGWMTTPMTVVASRPTYHSGPPGWLTTGYDLSTLRTVPTFWEKVKAFFGGRAAIPRAILINTDSKIAK